MAGFLMRTFPRRAHVLTSGADPDYDFAETKKAEAAAAGRSRYVGPRSTWSTWAAKTASLRIRKCGRQVFGAQIVYVADRPGLSPVTMKKKFAVGFHVLDGYDKQGSRKKTSIWVARRL